MELPIVLKHNTTTGVAPLVTDLQAGEVAINSADGKMFILQDNGVDAASVVEIGAGGGGIAAVVDDTSPELGGNLNTGSFQIGSDGDTFISFDSGIFARADNTPGFQSTLLNMTADGTFTFSTSGAGGSVNFQVGIADSFISTPLGVATPTDDSHAATKLYVDNAVTSGVVGAVVYKGVADASAADAEAATGEADPQTGFLYRVTTAGNTAFGYQANVGDYVIYNGTSYDKWDSVDPTISGTADRITVTGDQTAGFTVNLATTFGLSGLADVDLTDLADGALLQYNATSEKFEAVLSIDGGTF